MASFSGKKPKYAHQYDKSRQQQLKLKQKHIYYTRIANAFVLFIWCFLLFVPTNGYANIPDVRAIWLVVLTSLSLIAFLVTRIKFNASAGLKALIKSLSIADWAALVYTLALFAACVASPYQDLVWLGAFGRREGFFVQLCYIIAYFTVSRNYEFKPQHGSLLAWAMLVVALVGILQHHYIDILGLYQNDLNGADIFLTFIGNVNLVSAVAGMMCVFFALMFIKTTGRQQWLYFSATAAMFYLQLCAGSDSGWVNIAAGMFVSIPFFATGRMSITRYGIVLASFGVLGFVKEVLIKNMLSEAGIRVPASIYATGLGWKWLLLSLLGGVVVLAALILGKRIKLSQKAAFVLCCVLLSAAVIGGLAGIEIIGRDPGAGNVYQAREMLHGNLDDHFMNERGYIWKSTFKLIKRTAFLGSGPDTLSRLHMEAYGDEAKRITGHYVDKSHNEYLEYAISSGILGLAAYLLLVTGTCARWAKRAYTGLIKNSGDNMAYVAAGCSVLAYLAQAVFNFSMPVSAPFFWVFLGMAASRKYGLKLKADAE